MDLDKVILSLDSQWQNDGFLDQVRRGQFAPIEGEKFVALINQIDLDSFEYVPKRLLTLVWYLPIFLSWQMVRIEKSGGDIKEFEKFTVQVHNSLENRIGVP